MKPSTVSLGIKSMLGSISSEDFRQQLERAFFKYFDHAVLSAEDKATLLPVGLFSIEMNISLAAKYHGIEINWAALILAFIKLEPIRQYQYFKYSRVPERVFSRLRVGFVQSPFSLPKISRW